MDLLDFKVWHKDAKQYCEGGNRSIFQWVEDGQPVVLYQFTGLKDIDGEKIYYNKDIVEFEVYISNKGFASPCQWIKLKGTFNYSEEELRAEIDILPKYEKYGYVCLVYNLQCMRNFKIIGDVNEN